MATRAARWKRPWPRAATWAWRMSDAGGAAPASAQSAQSQDIARAAALLRAGELVAFPTETVYGLGADARNPEAVAKVFAAKGRPADHPLIVHLASADALDAWATDIPAYARKLARSLWPGPLTLILKKQRRVPDAVTGGQDTVGLRVPAHPLALQLLQAFAGADNGGIAAPSANRFGRISPTTAQHVRDEFQLALGDRVVMVLDGGPCDVGIESTIVDCSRGGPVLLRPGAISAGRIAAVCGRFPVSAGQPSAPNEAPVPRASGTLAAHYAPSTPLLLVSHDGLILTLRNALAAGTTTAVLAPYEIGRAHV
jgi:L-threonylcarbamoyladenylate synthase